MQHTPYLDRSGPHAPSGSTFLASKPYGTLYIGVNNGLTTGVEQRRAGKASAFTRKYRVHLFIWYEELADVRQAIQREKTIKHYIRV